MEDVVLEHRLTIIEETMKQGFERMDYQSKTITIALDGLTQKVGKQNGRISVIEIWMDERVRDLAHAAGVLSGRRELQRRDLAVLAGVVAGISALSALVTHVGDLIHMMGG